ncbi:hypothetical protein [Naasia lichenicola]|uniref:Uncharacterized protein n=1 Tax=Naasia lichenicola TaxID=2565933 RepID=A0A4S4FI70_9MICO|nr:hypothetical protein [Naasia lichenicola]THG30010.1 hypothetical protein E6C64_15325 [Naasia lichenicola]
MNGAPRGRNTISARALDRVASAVTAEALDVSARHVRARIEDESGAIALHVSTPIRAISLRAVQTDAAAVQRSGGSLLQRAEAAQQLIRDDFASLTGSEVARVTVRLSSVDIRQEERVR